MNIFLFIFKLYSGVQGTEFLFSYSKFMTELQIHINTVAVMCSELSCHKNLGLFTSSLLKVGATEEKAASVLDHHEGL